MTPYELGILLHYFCRVGDADGLRAPIGPATLDRLVSLNLLVGESERERDDRTWKLSPRGEFYVTALLQTPFPELVQEWKIPAVERRITVTL